MFNLEKFLGRYPSAPLPAAERFESSLDAEDNEAKRKRYVDLRDTLNRRKRFLERYFKSAEKGKVFISKEDIDADVQEAIDDLWRNGKLVKIDEINFGINLSLKKEGKVALEGGFAEQIEILTQRIAEIDRGVRRTYSVGDVRRATGNTRFNTTLGVLAGVALWQSLETSPPNPGHVENPPGIVEPASGEDTPLFDVREQPDGTTRVVLEDKKGDKDDVPDPITFPQRAILSSEIRVSGSVEEDDSSGEE